MNVFQESPLASFSSIQPIRGWEDFLRDGRNYLATAATAHARGRKIFTPEILYNIVAMAIEKFVMAALMHRGTLPYNHTMADLVEAMEDIFPGALADIREGLLHMDTYQDICDPYEFTLTPPDSKEIPAMLELAARLLEIVETGLAARC